MSILLLDTHSLLHATYSLPAAKKLIPTDGPYANQPVGASYLFTRTLLSLIKTLSATSVVAFFDGGVAPWRLRLLPTYKHYDTRKTIDPDFELNRSLLLTKILPSLNILTFAYPNTEADDLLAYYVLHTIPTLTASKPNLKTYIISTDRDHDQLLDPPNLLRFDQRKHVFITQPANIIYKALTGDRSDNIPGVGQIGPKRAQALLSTPNLNLKRTLTPTQLKNLQRNLRLVSLHYGARRLPEYVKKSLSVYPVPFKITPASYDLFKSLQWNSFIQ